jgi:hypothetical protein
MPSITSQQINMKTNSIEQSEQEVEQPLQDQDLKKRQARDFYSKV